MGDLRVRVRMLALPTAHSKNMCHNRAQEGIVAHPSRSIDLTQVSEWQQGELRRFQDYLVAEEPLEIRVGGAPLTVTMRTPGHELELAARGLFTEGLIQKREQIASLEQGQAKNQEASGNLVQVALAGTEFERERMQRNFFAASSCGICG